MKGLVKNDNMDSMQLDKFRIDRRFPFAIEAKELQKCETFDVTEVRFR